MRSLIAFTKKEFIEQARSYKILILIAVFFVFGMSGPLITKLLPDIISSVDMQGMKIELPEQTYIDCYTQFFKNMGQMGIIIILLVFNGTISQEINNGTLINIVSKGLSRPKIILSKYVAACITWTGVFTISVVTNYFYTSFLFESKNNKEILVALLMMWLFGIFVLALIIFSSIVTSGNYGGLVLSAIIIGGLLLINLIPKSNKFNPIALASNNLEIINKNMTISEIYMPTAITIIAIVVLIIFADVVFNRKKL